MQNKAYDQAYVATAPPAYSFAPPTVQVHTQSSYPIASQPTFATVTHHPAHTVNFQPPTVNSYIQTIAPVTSVPVGPEPCRVQCPNCHNTVMTTVEYESTTRTHVVALLLFVFLCWPCICLPYCCNSCKNVNHHCPSCKSYIGTYQK